MKKNALASREFLLNAGQAVKLEQAGLLSEAAMWWRRVMRNRSGTSWTNTKWARHRAVFCQYWANRDINLKELRNDK